ncbi:hypothetical protein CLV63_119127 [Murinocardiopsis flavida]|uniref:Secreted protein n=1 Tax=Murinocardiopsis flavida TaxID=645275 RepID=A0A2P8D3R2_9ACTN|nr:HAD domain-containing protein [Murinocardiopsis flavida]PSK91846.1 hypothetical protein CLV63_119127 [Murinocardiopsis flavida]
MSDTAPPSRPLLFLDVDGPLNPFAAKAHRRPAGYTTNRVLGLRVWLNPSHGPRLLDLPYDLVWATTWEHEANAEIGPVLGLPELPVVSWPDTAPPSGLYFKTPTIVEYAAGRPFAWVDDDHGRRDREYVADFHDGPALLRHVHPAKGLCAADFGALAAWAAALPEAAAR